jgi:hypothetical protein
MTTEHAILVRMRERGQVSFGIKKGTWPVRDAGA